MVSGLSNSNHYQLLENDVIHVTHINNMRIKDLPKIERPREKLEKYGPERLTNSELLAILLGTGTKGVNVVELSNKILKKFSGDGLPKASVKDLKNTFGLGSAKACEISACFELGRRLLQNKQTVLLLSPQNVLDELKEYRDHKKEHLVALYLDSRAQEVAREVISIGTLNSNLIHPREVFEVAIKHSAAQLILVHNHPSGNSEPSLADIDITKDLFAAARILGIELIDHYIISSSGIRSIKDRISELS